MRRREEEEEEEEGEEEEERKKRKPTNQRGARAVSDCSVPLAAKVPAEAESSQCTALRWYLDMFLRSPLKT